ncbi:hypothetical protein [Variovorax sp. W6]|uniref:hypothetical protein n=1 Tax=Variovorax sp. W6 TaxID=3093895 RepID=UPI003D800572
MLDASRLAAWLAGTDIGLLELRTPQGTLRLGRQGDGIVELPEDEEEIELVPVEAPRSASSCTRIRSRPCRWRASVPAWRPARPSA